MRTVAAKVLFVPESDQLRYLPEGPYRSAPGQVSWVAIQHGPEATFGSLNLLDLATGQNKTVPLPGRPGFAFPTSRRDTFLVGMERSLILFNIANGAIETIADGVDQQVDGTIINDGLVNGDQLIFGCKDLGFAEQKAGLYLFSRDSKLTQLADDQVCSNGKAVRTEDDGSLTLFDICSCSKRVCAYSFNADVGTIAARRTVVDLTREEVFPDGLIMTPDERSLIVAIFNPGEAEFGEARQYSIASGDLESVWTCEASPRVTCPQLVEHEGRVRLLLTTADEGMEPHLRENCVNAGCLFIADTSFDSLNDNPVYPVGV